MTQLARRVLIGAAGRAVIAAAAISTATTVLGRSAQGNGRDDLARGRGLWDQRLSTSAIAALERAAGDRTVAADAHETLGRIYTFKGWQQDNVFPGWHDEPRYRDRAIAELKAALAIEPDRASARDALQTAEGFAAADKVDPAPPRPEIRALDARIDAARNAPLAELVAAIDARTAAQADAAPYFAGAQILIDRAEYDRAIDLAERGVAVNERFIDENLSAYQMEGKRQGASARGHATAADLVGWAHFMKRDLPGATAKLEEAERLFRGQDFANQFHLGELARAKNERDPARDHYLSALSLSLGPAPLRQRATQAIGALYAAGGAAPGGSTAGFDAWLEQELSRRREERRALAVKSLVDKPLPRLALTTVDGRPYDAAGLRGKILLLNFFASW
jgi:hypothetical protein